MPRISSAQFLKSVSRIQDLPRDRLPQVAFVGRSNVGKSSLINFLLNQGQLAKTSKTPGKTKVINFFLVNKRFYFVDLPGYGFARVPDQIRRMWVRLIGQYLEGNEDLRLVVWLFDVRRVPDQRDADLCHMLRSAGIPTVIALTKCDKVNRSRITSTEQNLRRDLELGEAVPLVRTSVKKRLGRKELSAHINTRIAGV